jgi:predicted nucleotidyltransferase
MRLVKILLLFSYLRGMSLPECVQDNLERMRKELCLHPVSRAYLFGSVTTERFSSSSDIDILLEFEPDCDPLEKGESIGLIQEKLEDLLHRPVDVVSATAIKNPFFLSSIEQNQFLFYGE